MPRHGKLFYKIGEVCKTCEVPAHVLRYWESEFPALSPTKNRSGQRLYRERDVQIIKAIKHLLYEEGYTIAGASKKLKSNGHLPEELPLFSNAAQRKDQQQVDEIKKDLEDLLRDLDADPQP